MKCLVELHSTMGHCTVLVEVSYSEDLEVVMYENHAYVRAPSRLYKREETKDGGVTGHFIPVFRQAHTFVVSKEDMRVVKW